jgi:hypothetical protein
VNVTIAGSECIVTQITSNQIECRTNSYSYSSIVALVNVFIQDAGFALNVLYKIKLNLINLK